MRATYDSEARALSIDLISVPRWDDSESVNDDYCQVALFEGQPANVELLEAADNLAILEQVADRFGLDVDALRAAAQSALAAPDREVTVEVASRTSA